jgi:hypothetical protein
MANDASTTQWRIDSLPFTYPYRVYIAQLNWTDQTAVGNQVVITQANGKPIIDSRAQQINFQQNFGKLGWVNGITVATLDSGVIEINVGGNK